jgi:uncharacterized protein YjbI with pentapeptide repeats
MITNEQLQQHAAWIRDGSGMRLEAINTNLAGANLRWANLQEAELHGANLSGANLKGADLRWANLQETNLAGANLCCANLQEAELHGANLKGAIGNMSEIKSAQFDQWAVTWSADVLAIGCQQHAIEKWRNADPRWIAAMDSGATDWWSRYGAVVLQLVDASPATGVVLEQQEVE